MMAAVLPASVLMVDVIISGRRGPPGARRLVLAARVVTLLRLEAHDFLIVRLSRIFAVFVFHNDADRALPYTLHAISIRAIANRNQVQKEMGPGTHSRLAGRGSRANKTTRRRRFFPGETSLPVPSKKHRDGKQRDNVEDHSADDR